MSINNNYVTVRTLVSFSARTRLWPRPGIVRDTPKPFAEFDIKTTATTSPKNTSHKFREVMVWIQWLLSELVNGGWKLLLSKPTPALHTFALSFVFSICSWKPCNFKWSGITGFFAVLHHKVLPSMNKLCSIIRCCYSFIHLFIH